jgi:hypothetical protein
MIKDIVVNLSIGGKLIPRGIEKIHDHVGVYQNKETPAGVPVGAL